jgi:hypothetical protein
MIIFEKLIYIYQTLRRNNEILYSRLVIEKHTQRRVRQLWVCHDMTLKLLIKLANNIVFVDVHCFL